MSISTDAVGKVYPPLVYAVGREKIREFAAAVGETNPLHCDVEAARAAGYDDVVAPPMFAVVYAGASLTPALFDPEVGIAFAMMVHGGQEFRWGRLVVAGDEITTTTSVKDISSRGGLGFYVFETESKDREGETVCTGVWTNIVRGSE
ncbi:MAG TPA: MaoC family dehydratase N-terminal domain-containing protein [Solirubrobacteraceae bacterium]|nr:MaoC family dehydratase N-terminal domain-containing protein [Solirubrobacteraceae bacterium]